MAAALCIMLVEVINHSSLVVLLWARTVIALSTKVHWILFVIRLPLTTRTRTSVHSKNSSAGSIIQLWKKCSAEARD
jgi:hypothetical protein